MKHIFDGKSFGKRIKMQRVIEDEADMRAWAKKVGVSPATISRIENGGMPDLLTYASLCYFIGANLNEFVYKRQSKSSKK